MALDPFALGKVGTLTTAQKKDAARAQIEAILGNAARQLLNSYHALMKEVYKNASGLSLDEVVSKLSQDESIELRQYAIIIKSALEAVKPGVVSDAPYTIMVNGQSVPVVIPIVAIDMPANIFPEYGG